MTGVPLLPVAGLPEQERHEAREASDADRGYFDDRDRPSAAEIAQDEADFKKLWPVCRRCTRKTLPGMECHERLCPWHRVDGKVVEAGRL